MRVEGGPRSPTPSTTLDPARRPVLSSLSPPVPPSSSPEPLDKELQIPGIYKLPGLWRGQQSLSRGRR